MARIIQTANLRPDDHLSQNENDWIYNGLDCCVTLEVYHRLAEQIDPVAQAIYNQSRALQAPVMSMQLRGILVDQQKRGELLGRMKREAVRLEANLDRIITEGVGIPLNWRSPLQLRELLYGVMDLPEIRRRNAQGRMVPTVDRKALERLTQYFYAEPIINYILALRDLAKDISLLETRLDSDGRLRCNYNIAGTNTGRLASSESDFGTGTNSQNIKRSLREIFIADRGMKFCNIDLEQADSRNVGANCWNKFVEEYGEAFAGSYLDACESGDLHTTVARMAWTDLPWTNDERLWRQVADTHFARGKSYRDASKGLGHGTNYYMQKWKAAQQSGLTISIAEDFQRRYLNAFPCIEEGHNWTRRNLRDTSMFTTIWGRRRVFFGRWNDDETFRAAVAFEGQSPTADEINRGMLNLWEWDAQRWIIQLLVQVHDSILFQYPEEMEDEIVSLAVKLMEIKTTLKKGREFYVPAEAKVGWNWGDWSEKNPDGLMKWKGGDSRKREREPARRLTLTGR